jgi:hypothetical protein
MKRVLKADLHIHSNFSDGRLSIAEIVDLYGKNGFDVIAITDHLSEGRNLIGQVTRGLNLSLTPEKFEQYRKEIHSERIRAREQYGMNLIFGYEITKNSFVNSRSCHVLILGLETFISPDLPVEEILCAAKEKGALTIAAHPFHTGDFEFQTFYLWSRREQLRNFIDAWEVSYRKKISPEVMQSGFPLIASSDFHRSEHLSSWKTLLYCENNLEAIRGCLKKQNIDFFYFTA